MRVALTGAEGFTGRYVTAELDRRGIEWIALAADITDAAAVDAAVSVHRFDALIHLAAIAFAGGNDWNAFYWVNQLGTFNLLDSIARYQPGTICLLASSAQIYGPGASGLIDEAAPANPANHYAVSKYAMEQGAVIWSGALDIRIARPFNYTGVGQEDRYLVPKIVSHFARRVPVIELGNTHVLRDFGDVRAVASAYCDLIGSNEQGLIVNVASGVVRSIDEIMQTLGSLTGHRMEIQVNPTFVRANDVPVLGGNPAALRRYAPAWEPVAFDDTLAWMLEAAEADLRSS